MRILITGATGFIGRHVTNALSKQYEVWPVSRNQCDLTNFNQTQNLLQDIKPNVVIHLAANPLVKLNEENPTEIIDSNIKATQNICHNLNPGTYFIFTSTILVYGNLQHSNEQSPCYPTNVYGATKLASEAIIRAYEHTHGIQHLILRLCATVGNNTSHGIVKDFFNKIRAENNFFPVIGNNPGSVKPFCHVDDVISMIKLGLSQRLLGTFNIVPDDVASVKDIAELFIRKFKSNKEIYWMGSDSNWKGDNAILLCENDKAVSVGWQRKYTKSLDAIERVIDDNIIYNFF